MEDPKKYRINVRISHFAEMIPDREVGWRRFAVVQKVLDLNRTNAPTFEIVSRHWTAGGAERRARKLNATQKAAFIFQGNR